MATVRCPKCGTVNPNGRRRLARCYKCHEALGKCRYCKHFDLRILDCTSGTLRSDEHVTDPDEVRDCPDFVSRLTGGVSRARPTRAIITGIVLVWVMALAGVGVFLLLRAFTEETPTTSLHVSADAPSSVMQDEVLSVTVLVANQGGVTARDVMVTLTGRGMANLICQAVTPEECYWEATPKAASAALGDIEAGTIQSVSYRFLPAKPCLVSLTAHVTAANLQVPVLARVECRVLP